MATESHKRSHRPSPKPWYRRIRLGISAQIFVITILEFVAIAVAIHLISIRRMSPGHVHATRMGRHIAGDVTSVLSDPAAVQKELARVRDELHGTVSVYDQSGRMIATNDPAPLPAEQLNRAVHGPGVPIVLDVDVAGPPVQRLTVSVRFTPAGSPGTDAAMVIPAILVIVGAAAMVIGRLLTRPLVKLSAAAQRFGDGHLDTRVALTRNDEFGEVASAFDDMASRIAHLVRSQKELLANISHELRTPLARIRVALDIAQEGDAAMAQKMTEGIAQDLGEVERLVDDVLTTARLDLARDHAGSALPPLRLTPLDPADLVQQAVDRFHQEHPHHEIKQVVEPNLPNVDADAVLLRRLIDNILKNAGKYSDAASGPIEIGVRQQDDCVSIEIRDHGIGMSAEDLPKAFDPFFRSDRSRTRSTGGLGLGLALAKSIAEAHRGDIAISSELGKGTSLQVTIPVRSREPSARI